jgi:hypothetical protein
MIEGTVGIGSKVNACVGSGAGRREERLFYRSMLEEPMNAFAVALHFWVGFL